jgi:hypothetical protein
VRRLFVLCALGASQVSCSLGHSVTPEAFRRTPSFAIVNVNTAERVSYTEPKMVRAPGGGMDMSSTGFDAGPAAGIFPETKAAAVRALSRSHRFRLLSEDEVISSAAYASAQPHTGPFFGGAKFIPARGYKLIFDEAVAARLARATGANAALIVNLHHTYTSAGEGLAGRVTVMATAIDRSGRIIWKDFATVLSEHSMPSRSTKVSPATIQPLLVESTERGIRAMLQRLDEYLRKWK